MIPQILADQLARPKTHSCVVRYLDGREYRIDHPSRRQAENCAERNARRIGKPVIDRDTGLIVVVSSVTVEAIQ